MADRNGGWNTGKNDFVYVGCITKIPKEIHKMDLFQQQTEI